MKIDPAWEEFKKQKDKLEELLNKCTEEDQKIKRAFLEMKMKKIIAPLFKTDFEGKKNAKN